MTSARIQKGCVRQEMGTVYNKCYSARALAERVGQQHHLTQPKTHTHTHAQTYIHDIKH